MNEDEPLSFLSGAPTELLICIFRFVRPVQLLKCRQVCMRWKLIIDKLLSSDISWYKFCKQDFKDVYKAAFYKNKCGLSWRQVYRTLSLWPRIREARESRDEFASAANSVDEVRDFQVLRDGIVGVHNYNAIIYYDLDTMEVYRAGNIQGNYLRYKENRASIVILRYNFDLCVIRKYAIEGEQEESANFRNVKTFILRTHEVYFVTLNESVYICRLDEQQLNCVLLTQLSTGVICIGYSKHLNILTFERQIYSLIGKECKLQCTLGPTTNLLHELKKYKLLENMDWQVYYEWMHILKHSVPQGPLRDILVIKTYGEVVFIGSNWGVFRIYYAPYINDEFDIFNSEPIKQYNFMERFDCPVLSMCPIIQIDVIEGEDSHSILIAMPKKIAVITLTHDFNETTKLPLSDLSDVKIILLND